ncbi:ABC transporter permease [Ureibacillus manganicus]|uniref:ABC transporter permease n=1 Tax=Ureibacillus manganicus TaxID=1266064 RepID=UPI000691C803|nr:ABC transporter permease [Ureibacillus manganicus]
MKAITTSEQEIKIPKPKIIRIEYLLSLLLLVFILVLWEVLSRFKIVHELILPGPMVVIGSMFELLAAPFFYSNLGVTLFETLAGFALGSIFSIVLALIVVSVPILYKVLNPFIIILQAVPKVALAPIFVTWFGFGLTAKIVMAIAICFFPTFINTVVGLKSVDEDSKLLFQSMVASKKDLFLKLSLPTALPYIFAGLKASLTFALIGAIVGEFMGADKGIGMLINTFNFQLEMDKVYALIIILSIIALLLYLFIEWLDKKIVFWTDNK